MENNEKYQMNEMNLQAYRLMFIPLEAILLVIGILIQDQPRFLFIFFLGLRLVFYLGSVVSDRPFPPAGGGLF